MVTREGLRDCQHIAVSILRQYLFSLFFTATTRVLQAKQNGSQSTTCNIFTRGYLLW